MGSFTHRGISLYYEERGEGIPFLFLHGLGNDCGYTWENIDAREGVRLISMDQQGHGRSGFDRAYMSFDSLGDDVLALADALGLDRFYLGGLSMGAGVSVNVAVRCPERLKGLILVRPAWLAEPMPADMREYFGLLARCLPLENGREIFLREPAVQRLLKERSEGVQAFLPHFGAEDSRRRPEKFAIMPGQQPIREAGQLAGLRLPTLVAACRGDFVHPFEYGQWYAGHIPGARFEELPAKSLDAKRYHERLNECVGEMVR